MTRRNWSAGTAEKIASETSYTLHYSGQFSDINPLKEKWSVAKQSPCRLELGGFDKNKLISHLSFYKPFPFHPYEKHTIEFFIIILKEHCLNGLGSKKIFIMEKIAREMGIKRIQARVRTSNYIGITLYQKLGYEIEGIRKSAVFINGNYENEFYIAKILD